jgi:hypothetical protein
VLRILYFKYRAKTLAWRYLSSSYLLVLPELVREPVLPPEVRMLDPDDGIDTGLLLLEDERTLLLDERGTAVAPELRVLLDTLLTLGLALRVAVLAALRVTLVWLPRVAVLAALRVVLVWLLRVAAVAALRVAVPAALRVAVVAALRTFVLP